MNQPINIPLTKEQYTACAARIYQEAEVNLTGDCGTLNKFGCTISYLYVESKAQLTVTVLSKPWELSEGFVQNQILNWFRG